MLSVLQSSLNNFMNVTNNTLLNELIYKFCIYENINLILSVNYYNNNESVIKLHALYQ